MPLTLAQVGSHVHISLEIKDSRGKYLIVKQKYDIQV